MSNLFGLLKSFAVHLPLTLLVAYILLSPFLQIALGQRIWKWVLHLFRLTDVEIDDRGLRCATYWLLGLLIHLSAVFFLKCAGLPWLVSLGVSYIPVVFLPKSVWRSEVLFTCKGNLNFVLWFFAILGIGVSLFGAYDGIQTAWSNNYGDLTFHLGMIASFVHGDNFPPQYHIYAGNTLSYPFLINFWSATFWWVNPNYKLLSFIFTFQWVVLWCAVYAILRGNRYWFAPWAVLFGGGSLFAWSGYVWGEFSPALNSLELSQKYSWQLIDHGYPWTVFLTTIWVTQRAALFGCCSALAALRLAFEPQRDNRARFLLCGTLLALSPLAHAHIAIISTCCIGLYILLNALFSKPRRLKQALHDELKWFLFPFVISFIFLPWLIGKSGIAKFITGWSVSSDSPISGIGGYGSALKLWILNAPIILTAFGILSLVCRNWAFSCTILILFVLGNSIQLALWNWDQIKVFIAIYLAVLAYWVTGESRKMHLLHVLFMPLLCVCGVMECWKIFNRGEVYTVYTKEALHVAADVRKSLPANEIIAAAPDHNSPATLTGHNLFYGYPGTLWSHGINYTLREVAFTNAGTLADCKKKAAPEVKPFCPKYLIWATAEKSKYGTEMPGEPWRTTASEYLYELMDD